MSTGLECEFVGVKNGKTTRWYYIMQDWDCPVGAWDWREYASCFGPFLSEDEAQKHLSRNHANPGGWTTGKIDEHDLDEIALSACQF